MIVSMIGTTRNLFLGSGLAYAVQKEDYLHIPVIVLFPSVYVGYHSYMNKDIMAKWIATKWMGCLEPLGRGATSVDG